jgi:membrane associated rhomboid family serine protease
MGIYDREYYRREGPSFFGSFAGRGQVCKWLIGINVAVFVVQLVTMHRIQAPDGWVVGPDYGAFTGALVLDPDKVIYGGEVWRLLTYAFLHDPVQLMHILVNMFFLWFFGKDVEDLYGPREFLAFYLVSAVLGGLAFLLWAIGKGAHVCLGASGAVTAVMVLYAIHYPSRVIHLWFLIPIPTWFFVFFQVAQDAFVFVGNIKTSTAVTVHLAGAAFALAYYKGHWRLLGFWSRLRSWQQQRGRPRLRVYREERPQPVAVASTTPASEADDQLEAKLDAVLEKVARHGQGSLSESERKILMRASEIYKRRRT